MRDGTRKESDRIRKIGRGMIGSVDMKRGVIESK